jgi:hypothetical protein
VVHVLVRLDGHELVHLYRAGLAHPPEVVALEVDQHDVLGPLLRVSCERTHLTQVLAGLAAARAGAGDRARIDTPPRDPHQPLGG